MVKAVCRFGIVGLVVSLLSVAPLSASAQNLGAVKPGETNYHFKDICIRSLFGINDEVLADTDRFPLNGGRFSSSIEPGVRFGDFTNATVTISKDVDTGKPGMIGVRFVKKFGPETDDKELQREYEHAVNHVSKLLGVKVECRGLVDLNVNVTCRPGVMRLPRLTEGGRIISRTRLHLAKGYRVEIAATEASYVIRSGQPIQTAAPMVSVWFLRIPFGTQRSEGDDAESVKELTLGPDYSELLSVKMRVPEEEKAQREAEREQQRQHLLQIQEELKRAREARQAAEAAEAAKSGNSVAETNNTVKAEKVSVAEKLETCDFLLNKDFKKNAKYYLCLFSASWCPPCRREMPRIAKTYVDTLKEDPDIELIHFSRDQDEDKALAWAKEHDVKFPVVKPKGGNPLDLRCSGIPHLFILKADGTLVEHDHPMRIFNEEKFKELKEGTLTAATKPQEGGEPRKLASGAKNVTEPGGLFTLEGPYGIRMTADPGCEKGAEYVMNKLIEKYLPVALRYYGDPFKGKKPTRIFTVVVKRNDGSDGRNYTGPSWGSCSDGIDRFTIGLSKGSDKWEMDNTLLASKILTVCREDDAALQIYANKIDRGLADGLDPVPALKEDIRQGIEKAGDGTEKKGRLEVLCRLAPMWSVFEELRKKHPTFILDYHNLKNSRFACGKLSEKVSLSQMVGLLAEVTGENVLELCKKYGVKGAGKNSVAEKLGTCDFLLNKDFKKNAKYYLCLFSASWCPPCRREMPRIAKTYLETLKDDPDIELIHFSRDQDEDKALAWAKEHDVKFPVVKPKGGNPLDLRCSGIPHLFILKADGTLVEHDHPMRIFNEEKFKEIKGEASAGDKSQDKE